MKYLQCLSNTDIEVAKAIKNELVREESKLVLIASENYTSQAVLEAVGSVLTNKYAEGYPAKRYYGGCENADTVESLAIKRAKELFGSEHANVQPHSGSSANMGVLFSCLEPGDVVLGMELSHGGHLTHGYKINFSGKLFKSYSYGVNRESGLIEYDEVRRIAEKVKPKIIIAGASSYSRIIDFKKFKEIADDTGALFMCDIAHIAGLVVAGVHPNPTDLADFVTTTTHKTLRGPRGGLILSKSEYAKKIDYSVFPGIQGGPIVNIIAGKAVAFKEAQTEQFKEIQIQTVSNSKELCNSFVEMGYNVVSGGTDNHLFVVDLTGKGVTGAEAQQWLDDAGITLNKNAIPYDPNPPAVTGGIRIGTPIVTTRGMGKEEMRKIAFLIDKIITKKGNDKTIKEVRQEVRELCHSFPFYQDLIDRCNF
jgi:glycine hydroxymethyltransferase